MKFPQAEEPQILVGKVPVCFTEKESNELRRGRLSVIRPIVEVRQIQSTCSLFIKVFSLAKWLQREIILKTCAEQPLQHQKTMYSILEMIINDNSHPT